MSRKRNGMWSVKAKEKDVVNLMCVDNLEKAWLLALIKQSLLRAAYTVLFYDFEFLFDECESCISEANQCEQAEG